MKSHFLRVLCVLALLFAGGCNKAPGTITVSALTLNNAPPGARMRAGYLSVENGTDQARRLVRASSNAFGLVEFHRTEEVDGQSRMREEKNITVLANDRVVFEPFGLHLMLMRPTSPTVADVDVTVELCFDDGDCITALAAR